jgi:dGTPase
MASDRAPYASDPMASRGRLHGEPESETRTCFQRDRDRIIHSTALRRLMHKTQVFVSPEGDHFRTRLTHSLEVAQIARGLARSMSLDVDLAEALALAHDFGHPPFGHAGEEALDAMMKPFGGFDHNDQTLRVVTQLEQRYAAFDGLNLTWETLEGLVKHNGPLTGRKAKKKALPKTIAEYSKLHGLELDSFAGPEAQVAAIADDIAYDNHDVDDGLRARLFTMKTLTDAVPHVAEIYDTVSRHYSRIDPGRVIQEVVRRLIDAMVNDVLSEARRRIREADPISAAAIRALPQPVVAFSPVMVQKDRDIKAFLFENMYRHPSVTHETEAAREIVRELFEGFMDAPDRLPEPWRKLTDGPGTGETARVVADYIAGMTDRYATRAHRQLTSGEPAAE